MKRKIVTWTWEDPDAQRSFGELVGFPDEQQTSAELDNIEGLLELRPPLRVLDVGCGTGRHAIAMARRGYEVVGIDVAEKYLDEARNEAGKHDLDIEFRLQRGSAIREEQTYDFALAFYHTLGFMSDDEIARHLTRIRSALKASGKLLLVLAGPRLVEGHESAPIRSWTERGGTFILVDKRIEAGHRHERTVVIDTRSDELTEYIERQRAFSLSEVKDRLADAGFTRVDCLKNLDGDAATPEDFGVFVCVAG